MSDSHPFAIVTDGLWRKSVCAIRSLGRAGFRVVVSGDGLLTTGFYSRYTTMRFKGPTAAEDPEGFGSVLQRALAATKTSPTVILPMEDASCRWLLANEFDLPPHAKFLLPEGTSFSVASDKALTAAAAEQCGIPCPKCYIPESPSALCDFVGSNDIADFVLKPRCGSGSGGIVYGSAIQSVDFERHWDKYGALLLQERIPSEGQAFGVSLLYDSVGSHVASFEHRRLRQYPISGGPSTQRVSVALGELTSLSRRLLESLQWRGVAMVEWKYDPRSGTPLLLEINPRFWGSLALAVRAGVDFPTLYANAVLGKPLSRSVASYQVGTMSRWLIPGDILRYFNEPPSAREPLSQFLRGIIRDSEEFDSRDVVGSLASCMCTGLLALNPRYWKYVGRR